MAMSVDLSLATRSLSTEEDKQGIDDAGGDQNQRQDRRIASAELVGHCKGSGADG